MNNRLILNTNHQCPCGTAIATWDLLWNKGRGGLRLSRKNCLLSQHSSLMMSSMKLIPKPRHMGYYIVLLWMWTTHVISITPLDVVINYDAFSVLNPEAEHRDTFHYPKYMIVLKVRLMRRLRCKTLYGTLIYQENICFIGLIHWSTGASIDPLVGDLVSVWCILIQLLDR